MDRQDIAGVHAPRRNKRANAMLLMAGILVVLTCLGVALYHHQRWVAYRECIALKGPALQVNNVEASLQSVISDLQAYYADHDEYPPYLFGGQAELEDGLIIGVEFQAGSNPDPLIAGGYMPEYPALTPCYGDCRRTSYRDPRDNEHWRCAYSTPGDWRMLGEWNPDAYFAGNNKVGVPDNLDQLQFFSLAGGSFTQGGAGEYALWSQPLANQYLEQGPGPFHLCCRFRLDLLYFGYSRGEWYGGGMQECWFWQYGSPAWHELGSQPPRTARALSRFLHEHNLSYDALMGHIRLTLFTISQSFGLDLIDISTGELRPDGIPDGICLLYKLKEGEVIEVVRAEDT